MLPDFMAHRSQPEQSNEGVEQWLHTEVVAAYDELRADPSKAISSEDMRAHLAALHEQRTLESGA